MTRKGRTLKEIRDSQERKPKLIFQLQPAERAEYRNLQYLMKSLHLWHTHTHKWITWLFFFLIQKSCAGDRAPSCWYRSWMESSGMAQCRCQNQSKAMEFWEGPPITENLCCPQMVSWISLCMRRAPYWCPPGSRLSPVPPKRSGWIAA